MNGETFLIFTTEQGGYFKTPTDEQGAIMKFEPVEFEDLKMTRHLYLDTWKDQPRLVKPYFIALARVEDNFDWGLGSSRDAASVREP